MHEIPKLDQKGLRNFGLLTGTIAAVLFGILLPWIWQHAFPLWPWIVAAVLWFWALIAPKTLNPVYQIWMRVGLVLGWINTRIILGLIFYVLVTPMSLVMRLFGRDSMTRRFEPNYQTSRIKSHQNERERTEKPY